jgi:hypothetical protein
MVQQAVSLLNAALMHVELAERVQVGGNIDTAADSKQMTRLRQRRL